MVWIFFASIVNVSGYPEYRIYDCSWILSLKSSLPLIEERGGLPVPAAVFKRRFPRKWFAGNSGFPADLTGLVGWKGSDHDPFWLPARSEHEWVAFFFFRFSFFFFLLDHTCPSQAATWRPGTWKNNNFIVPAVASAGVRTADRRRFQVATYARALRVRVDKKKKKNNAASASHPSAAARQTFVHDSAFFFVIRDVAGHSSFRTEHLFRDRTVVRTAVRFPRPLPRFVWIRLARPRPLSAKLRFRRRHRQLNCDFAATAAS